MAGPLTRLLIANLDFESSLAAMGKPDGSRSPIAPLSPLAARTAAALGTLMRVFARDEDTLWLPAEVPAGRLDGPAWLARPRLVSGPLGSLAECGEVLAWGETASITDLRSRSRHLAPPDLTRDSLARSLWTHHPDPQAARAANHRGFALACAREIGVALPEATLVDSLREVDERIASRAADTATGDTGESETTDKPAATWVLKAPFTAAGRDRVLGTSHELTGAARRHVAALLERFGELLFEPWLERTADFGCSALAERTSCRIAGVHRQIVDRRGRIRAIEVDRDPAAAASAAPPELETIRTVARDVGLRLASIGYEGPFGIDAWRWRTRDGTERLHPLGEVNARLSFGLVARALLDRWSEEEPRTAPAALRLVLGPAPTAAATAICVLRPAPDDDRAGAWIEPIG